MASRKRPATDTALSNTKATKIARETGDLRWTDVFSHGNKCVGLPPMFFCSCSSEPGKIKIAAMDLDWTIVGTKSKKNFPTGENTTYLIAIKYLTLYKIRSDPSDWCWLYPSIPENLRQLSNDGFRLVIFTNQAGLEKKIATVDSVKKRIEQIQQNLHIPIQVCFLILHPSTFLLCFLFISPISSGICRDR